ncbi:cAMP-binding domain of CRP or a regulatory subunit of cAMP-dependent protein kinases [Filimonas lacunae]|uniref:cAMP-binding domain of CRP or a regulatory subunit of cAMP-dependent protein kinases n=1 Tax=Filimonas lacunae TaxID=477680 RepID=A0A173MBS1_9BACT|nr:Crp/Fnr family transcriptional regulator [Filimonas lacunae]BAV04918.1 Crp/Fnr family transcriptional regulator [Filimonas lacunae]SIT33802.1 cAMP-binding domain of CRP or a regulatory subunit of cAMP-dependent protein kinases [Filimonas lacunae]
MTDASFCEPLLKNLKNIAAIDLESEDIIIARSQEIVIPKGQVILREGTVSRYCYFIVSGKARSYYTDPDKATTTWLFHFNEPFSNAKNLFINDYKSFLTGLPATLTIETLTEVTAIRWSYDNFEYMCKHIPVFEKLMRKLNEAFFIVMYDRISSLLTLSAAERYKKLLLEEPHLINMFSNYYLASYLHVTPQSLSRIKSKCLGRA